MIGFGASSTVSRCSRSGCRAEARWNINWRNPRIHDLDRVKVWAACDEHRDYLYDYLDARDLPVSITPFGVVLERMPEADAS